MQTPVERMRILSDMLDFINRHNPEWLACEGPTGGLTPEQTPGIYDNPRFLFGDVNTNIAKKVAHELSYNRLLKFDMINDPRSLEVHVCGVDDTDIEQPYSLAFIGKPPITIGEETFNKTTLETKLKDVNPEIKIISQNEIIQVYRETQSAFTNRNFTDLYEKYGPLGVIVVSNDPQFNGIAESHFTNALLDSSNKDIASKKFDYSGSFIKDDINKANVADVMIYYFCSQKSLVDQLKQIGLYRRKHEMARIVIACGPAQYDSLINHPRYLAIRASPYGDLVEPFRALTEKEVSLTQFFDDSPCGREEAIKKYLERLEKDILDIAGTQEIYRLKEPTSIYFPPSETKMNSYNAIAMITGSTGSGKTSTAIALASRREKDSPGIVCVNEPVTRKIRPGKHGDIEGQAGTFQIGSNLFNTLETKGLSKVTLSYDKNRYTFLDHTDPSIPQLAGKKGIIDILDEGAIPLIHFPPFSTTETFRKQYDFPIFAVNLFAPTHQVVEHILRREQELEIPIEDSRIHHIVEDVEGHYLNRKELHALVFNNDLLTLTGMPTNRLTIETAKTAKEISYLLRFWCEYSAATKTPLDLSQFSQARRDYTIERITGYETIHQLKDAVTRGKNPTLNFDENVIKAYAEGGTGFLRDAVSLKILDIQQALGCYMVLLETPTYWEQQEHVQNLLEIASYGALFKNKKNIQERDLVERLSLSKISPQYCCPIAGIYIGPQETDIDPNNEPNGLFFVFNKAKEIAPKQISLENWSRSDFEKSLRQGSYDIRDPLQFLKVVYDLQRGFPIQHAKIEPLKMDGTVLHDAIHI